MRILGLLDKAGDGFLVDIADDEFGGLGEFLAEVDGHGISHCSDSWIPCMYQLVVFLLGSVSDIILERKSYEVDMTKFLLRAYITSMIKDNSHSPMKP